MPVEWNHAENAFTMMGNIHLTIRLLTLLPLECVECFDSQISSFSHTNSLDIKSEPSFYVYLNRGHKHVVVCAKKKLYMKERSSIAMLSAVYVPSKTVSDSEYNVRRLISIAYKHRICVFDGSIKNKSESSRSP